MAGEAGDSSKHEHDLSNGPSILIKARVQYSELGITIVTRKKGSGEIMSTHFDLPQHLQNFDHTTAEVLVPSQEALVDVPSLDSDFMRHFDHVGWVPTQDKASSNERQVNYALSVLDQKKDLYGGKMRFRIPSSCDVHGMARVASSTHSFCQGLISGLIAWGIEQREANRLPELRAIIGEHLASIAVIERTDII